MMFLNPVFLWMCTLTRFSVVAPMWEGDWRLGMGREELTRPTLSLPTRDESEEKDDLKYRGLS